MSPMQLDRPEWLDHFWDYRRGEHAAWIYPTGKGKSTLAYQCADVAMRPESRDLDFCSMMPKSQSPTTARWARELGLQETPTWPPRKKLFEAEPRGYVLWPKHRRDISAAENRAQLAEHFRKGFHDLLWKGDCIAFADDLHRLAVLMGLNTECEEWWTTGARGRGGPVGREPEAVRHREQRRRNQFPSHNCPTHMFFGRDTDQRNVCAGSPRSAAASTRGGDRGHRAEPPPVPNRQ